MRRALFLCLGIAAATWLEFQVFPGHTYLAGKTQLYLPMLERLDAPGFLSRDLVATHPTFAYTIYDEVTLFLHEACRLKFQTALMAQQLLFRAAGLFGVFLLSASAGLGDLYAFLLSTVVGLGAVLTGPGVSVVETEPIPSAFAFGLVLLSAGLLVREKPLLSGLAGGFALVYDPVIATPLWGVLGLAACLDGKLRRLLRPALTILVVFVLLLANLAQLQPGIAEPHGAFERLTTPLANLQQYRANWVWVSTWAPREIWHYLAIFTLGIWATARIWPSLNRPARWLALGLPIYGLLSIPISALLLEHFRWSVIGRVEPARALLFTVAMPAVVSGIAGLQAAKTRKQWEACFWLIVLFALPLNVKILDFLKVTDSEELMRLQLAVALAGGLVLIMSRLPRSEWRTAMLIIPIAAVFSYTIASTQNKRSEVGHDALSEMADWSEKNTWGSSMFLFPDAEQKLYPGAFRAQSRRALWVDWESGSLATFFESFAFEWQRRWEQTMAPAFSPQRLRSLVSLPVDYIVLKRVNRLADIAPVFANREYVMYDMRDLRNATAPFRKATQTAVMRSGLSQAF